MASRKSKDEPLGQKPTPASPTLPSQQQQFSQQPNFAQVDGYLIDRRMEFHQRGSNAQLYWPASIKQLGFETVDLTALPRTSVVEFSQQNSDKIVPKSPLQATFPKELDPQVWEELERARKPHAQAVLLYAAGRMRHSFNACEDARGAYDSALITLNTKPQNAEFDKFVKAENNKVVRLLELVRHLIQFQEFDQSFLFSPSGASENVPLTKKITPGMSRKFTLEEGVARYDDKAAPLDRIKKMTVYYWPKPLSEIGCGSLDLPILDDQNVEQLRGLNVEEVTVDVVEPISQNGNVDSEIWESLAYARSIYAKSLILYIQEQFVPARKAAWIAQGAYDHLHNKIAKNLREQSLLKFVEEEKKRLEAINKLVENELTWGML